ncbi:MAG: FecR family protein, partial [Hyphomicrobiales bacterium]|nr:FecR family protein [Hyphomicrobiales bacterium]
MMGIRKILAAGLAGVLALPLLTVTAQAAEWWIERMSGNVQVHDGTSWVMLDEGRVLNAGDSIWTGRNGRILLMNDQGSVLLAPRSLVKIPAQALPRNFSVLFQTHGNVTAEVDKRRTRHFSIQTPYLAAVVKGTEFEVDIKKKQTNVTVSEGLVGVVDIDTGETVDVPAGSTVSNAAEAGGGFGQVVAATASGSSGFSSSSNSRGGNDDRGDDDQGDDDRGDDDQGNDDQRENTQGGNT